MIKPERLQPGMTIGVIAPASAARDPIHVDHAMHSLEAMGFRVKLGKHVRGRHGFLASTDANRLSDLHAMFADKKVNAIMCLRGGYGTSRIVDDIDYDLVRQNPKVFIGFSDITMLNLAFEKKCRLVSFNGPMAASTFADTPASRFCVTSFLRTVCHAEAPGSIWQEHDDRNFRVIRAGEARGQLTGGNLSLLAASIGTRYEINTRNRIVFMEEIDEKPYRIDRMLTQLLSAGKLHDAAAIVIGRNVPDADFAEAEAKAASKASRTVKALPRKLPREFEPLMDDVFYDRLYPLGIPVISGLPFGHINDYATLPVGVMAQVNTRSGDLVIEERAVK
jgi:muramoyltetrapeptide carboxypeptidase